MSAATRAWIDGILQTLRAPLLIAGVLAITVASAVPFGLVLRSELRDALSNQAPIALGSSEVDADWWGEFSRHAEGLAATFTPTVIGFAAALDNLSSLLDATPRPLVLAIPAIIAILAWALIWPVALQRFHLRRGLTVSEMWAAASSNAPRFVAISVMAAAAQLLLFLTVHRLLFGVIYPVMAPESASEPAAFASRVALYIVFGAFLAAVSLAADYARIAQIVLKPASVFGVFEAGLRFMRANPGAVLALYVLTGLLFVLMFAGYGVVGIMGGTRVGGWRGVAIGQAFIIGRLIVRLIFGASEVALFKALRR